MVKLLHIFLQKRIFLRIISLGILCVLFFYLYKLLIPRINAFGCMDDCNNFMGGYFLLHGKILFTQIFFNHMPFMAHLSEFVQWVTKPTNLHELILRHRQFGLLFDLLSEAALVLRFGFVGIPFALLYETTKFYIGGDRFLAEGYIVYSLLYLLGIVHSIFTHKKIYKADYIISAFSFWFIFFMREPYILFAIFLFTGVLWGRKNKRIKIIACIITIFLFCLTFLSYNISEFYFNVVYVNKVLISYEGSTSLFTLNVYKNFLYPILIFFQGEWNFVRYIEIGVSTLFLFCSIYFLAKGYWKYVLFLWLALGLANLRYIAPGQEYYAAFHLIPWYGEIIFITCLMLFEITSWNKVLGIVGIIGLLGIVSFNFFSKGSYTHDKIDQQYEFITNYGPVMQVGSVVASLSIPKDTLFLDGFDDIIYFTAQRYSTYQYSWYTSLMPEYTKYTNARIAMFKNSPPDFYYGSCPGQKDPHYLLPSFAQPLYVRLYNLQSPSCVWVKKSKLPLISSTQWQKAGEALYFLKPHG